eukprot:TRINITY_DN3075_c0_g1_i3.p1 TRINITY_DN3075_c0_g1~~TRINITY_DN3075_c0_g1_i3.p1  ORF type:complete len:243 (+),score=38.48 TRINITY_DN3075_c0_g1_i3:114-842(+)
MIRRPPRSTLSSSSAASDVYKRQYQRRVRGTRAHVNITDSWRSLGDSWLLNRSPNMPRHTTLPVLVCVVTMLDLAPLLVCGQPDSQVTMMADDGIFSGLGQASFYGEPLDLTSMANKMASTLSSNTTQVHQLLYADSQASYFLIIANASEVCHVHRSSAQFGEILQVVGKAWTISLLEPVLAVNGLKVLEPIGKPHALQLEPGTHTAVFGQFVPPLQPGDKIPVSGCIFEHAAARSSRVRQG